MNGKNLVNSKKAAEMLGAHPHTVRKWAEKGEIPAIKAGRVWRFDPVMLREWASVKQTGHASNWMRNEYLEWLHGCLDDSSSGPPPYAEILKHCKDVVPVESCGIIEGSRQGDTYADLFARTKGDYSTEADDNRAAYNIAAEIGSMAYRIIEAIDAGRLDDARATAKLIAQQADTIEYKTTPF